MAINQFGEVVRDPSIGMPDETMAEHAGDLKEHRREIITAKRDGANNELEALLAELENNS